MVNGSDEPHDGDQQQKEAHGDHAADDVDAGDNAKAFPPCCYNNEQQAHQLWMKLDQSERSKQKINVSLPYKLLIEQKTVWRDSTHFTSVWHFYK